MSQADRRAEGPEVVQLRLVQNITTVLGGRPRVPWRRGIAGVVLALEVWTSGLLREDCNSAHLADPPFWTRTRSLTGSEH